MLVEADQGGVRKLQVAETFQYSSGIVVRTFDLMAHKRGLGANIRTDERIGDFVFTVTVESTRFGATPNAMGWYRAI